MPQTSFNREYINVQGSQGRIYEVTITGDQPIACSCPSFVHRLTACKHMVARMGSIAIGVTRCVQCRSWLSIADIESQPESADGEQGKLARKCKLCRV